MFSEKSKHLIEHALQKEEQGYAVYHYSFLRSSINSRALEEVLPARYLGGQATEEQANKELIHLLTDCHFSQLKSSQPIALFIDEAQFAPSYFPYIIDMLLQMGIEVYIACLHHDYQGHVFPMFTLLQEQFQQTQECYAICDVCGGTATENQRLLYGEPSLDGDLVVIDAAHGGENEYTYQPRCTSCFIGPVN